MIVAAKNSNTKCINLGSSNHHPRIHKLMEYFLVTGTRSFGHQRCVHLRLLV